MCPHSGCDTGLGNWVSRCPGCQKHVRWIDEHPKPYDATVSSGWEITQAELYSPGAFVHQVNDLLDKIQQRHKQRIVVFRGLRALNAMVLQDFRAVSDQRRWNGVHLHLPNVERLDFESLDVLCGLGLAGLHLDGVRSFGEPLDASSVSSFKGELSFSGLRKVSKELAEALANRDQHSITVLGGVRAVSEPIAEILAGATGELRMDLLSVLGCPPPLVARFYQRELSDFQRELNEELGGIDDIAEFFSEHAEITGGVVVSGDVTAETIDKLTGEHDLEFSDMEEIDLDQAKAIGNHKGAVAFPELQHMDGECFLEIVKNSKSVKLDSFKRLLVRDLVAALKKRFGWKLFLPKLAGISARAAIQLAQLSGEIQLGSGASLTIENVAILCKGRLRIRVLDIGTVEERVVEAIVKGGCKNITIDPQTELRRKLELATRDILRLAHCEQVVVSLESQVTFSNLDCEEINRFPGELRVVFKKQVFLDEESAKALSNSDCTLVFTQFTGHSDRVLRLVLEHGGTMVLMGVCLADSQCELLAVCKRRGVLVIPLASVEMPQEQIEMLQGSGNLRIRLEWN